jgi:hypothetical protein
MITGDRPKIGKLKKKSPSAEPAGTYYGTGVRAKMGKMRTGTGIGEIPVPNLKLKKPPKSLA